MYYYGICHKIALFITFYTKMNNLNLLHKKKNVWSQLIKQKQEWHANFSVKSTDVKHPAENLMIDYRILRMFVLSWHIHLWLIDFD